MKKHFCISCIFAICALMFCGCKVTCDYSNYISELRYSMYLYSGDTDEIKIYLSQKETPYAADGVKGDMNGLAEIYAKFAVSYAEVEIDVGGCGGEMSYMTVKDCWYLSFSCDGFESDSVTATVTCDGKSAEYTAINVVTDGVMDGKSALNCVIEYDGDLFKNLTQNGIFCGEIYVRLLYDGKCYYYVGVCDRGGNIKAYLTDGETGRVIAEHTSSA